MVRQTIFLPASNCHHRSGSRGNCGSPCGNVCAVRVLLLLFALALLGCRFSAPETASSPNIVLIMTDDQGWAQLGVHGDDVLQTPHLDQFAAESIEFTRFYVSPVCAPTRANLLTGRYNYRTGVVDTRLGRALMAPDEVTLAELLAGAGYRTSIFGKWHLGGNHPMRPIDQGFEESVVSRGARSRPHTSPETESYFDPVFSHNGELERYEGYSTDIYFNEAMRFIASADGCPFFVYLSTNAPHSPYLVPDNYREPYAAQGLDDKDARIYGMITNIDDNVGRLLANLDELGLAEETIVIFMTDNGPTTRRYNAGLRDDKGSTYEGGVRVPFFVRWPARLGPKQVDTIAAHIDVLPTLLDAAGIEPPGDLALDSRSLMPLLAGDKAADWPDRTLYVQSHRGDAPQLYRNFAAIEQRWKLVQPLSFSQPPPFDAKLQLYDLESDPGEVSDLASEHPEVVSRLQHDYEKWFADVSSERGFAAQPTYIGSEEQPEVTLTRQDWRSIDSEKWSPDDMGAWEVDVRTAGTYSVRVDFRPEDARSVDLTIGDLELNAAVESGQSVSFEGVKLSLGRVRVEDARNSVESGGSPEPPVYAALACDSGGCGRSFSSAASSFGRSR